MLALIRQTSLAFFLLAITTIHAAGADDAATSGSIGVERSRVYVKVGKSGFGHEHAVEGRLKSGVVALGAKEKAGELTFDMTTFKADGKAAREYVKLERETDPVTQKQVTESMLGEKVLDVADHPTALFTIKSAKLIEPTQADARERCVLVGDFTLRGVTKPVEINAAVERTEQGVHLVGDFKIKQTDYGITPFSKGLGLVGVADELTIYGDLWLVP